MLGLGSGMNKMSSAEAAAIAGRLPGFTGLLDESYGASAEAAYSVRKLTNRVSVAMTIRRDSDSTETDIGFDSNGNLDEGAITAFCTGTTCRVASWKDQSGNDNHAVQAVASNQPTIYTGGALVKIDGKVAMTLDGSNDAFTTSSNIVGAYSIFTLGNPTSSGYYADSTSGDRQYIIRKAAVAGSFSVHQNGTQTTGNIYDFRKELVAYISNSATTRVINTLLSRYNKIQSYNGDFSEYIIYTSDKSGTDQTSIEENIGDYFTQNTPLLDTYSGAAAAYSLRLLDSSYVGSAIRVRRSSDNTEQDIGFNVFGELDTVALAAHCGSNDGFVSKLYDQSGNGRDATQTTASYQRKIYDGTTGVVTYNGKPAMFYSGNAGAYLHSTPSSTTWTSFAVTKINSFPYAVHSRSASTGWWYLADSNTSSLSNGFTNVSLYKNGSAMTATTRTQLQTELGANHLLVTARGDRNTGGETWLLFSGYLENAGYNVKGYAQEAIIYDSDQSANRTGIETNINTFYNTY